MSDGFKTGLQIGWKFSALHKSPDNRLICPICGTSFLRRGKRKENGKNKPCCSFKCKAVSQKGKIIVGFNQKPKRGRIVSCKTCGKQFYNRPSFNSQFCSHSCLWKDADFRAAISGPNHYGWKGGEGSESFKLTRRDSKNRRRARLVNAFVENTGKFEQSIKMLSKISCFHCGKIVDSKQIHFDHLFPISKGGKHAVYNLVPSCPKCNISKHNKHPNDFIKSGQLLLT